MRKTICILALVLTCISTLCGCRCSHTWDDATCDTPKTCQFCGMTEGAPLGHTWKSATCDEPMFCEICHQTEGKPLPHHWADATCTTPKACITCDATVGEPLGHVWQSSSCEEPRHCTVCGTEDGTAFGHTWMDATCDRPKFCTLCNLTVGDPLGHTWSTATAEAPKTCTACGKTEGDCIVTDPRFDAATCKPLFGKWKARRSHTAENIGLTGQSFTFTEVAIYSFRNDGTATVITAVEDLDACKQAMTVAISDGLCVKCGSMEAAEQLILSYFGMTLEEYAIEYTNTYLGKIQNATVEGVYFVNGNNLFMSDAWNSEMIRYELILADRHLTLIDKDGERTELTCG